MRIQRRPIEDSRLPGVHINTRISIPKIAMHKTRCNGSPSRLKLPQKARDNLIHNPLLQLLKLLISPAMRGHLVLKDMLQPSRETFLPRIADRKHLRRVTRESLHWKPELTIGGDAAFMHFRQERGEHSDIGDRAADRMEGAGEESSVWGGLLSSVPD